MSKVMLSLLTCEHLLRLHEQNDALANDLYTFIGLHEQNDALANDLCKLIEKSYVSSCSKLAFH